MGNKWLKLEFAVHPGEILNDYLIDEGITQIELANKIALNKTIVNEIINGKRPITPRTAIKLEKVFSFQAKFWLNLQMIYNEAVERLKLRNEGLSCEATIHIFNERYTTEDTIITDSFTSFAA